MNTKEIELLIDDLYHKVGKVNVWRASNDVVCDLCEEYIKKKLKELSEKEKEEERDRNHEEVF